MNSLFGYFGAKFGLSFGQKIAKMVIFKVFESLLIFGKSELFCT